MISPSIAVVELVFTLMAFVGLMLQAALIVLRLGDLLAITVEYDPEWKLTLRGRVLVLLHLDPEDKPKLLFALKAIVNNLANLITQLVFLTFGIRAIEAPGGSSGYFVNGLLVVEVALFIAPLFEVYIKRKLYRVWDRRKVDINGPDSNQTPNP